MKHNPRVTIIMLILFFATQIVGLALVQAYMDEDGNFRNASIAGMEIDRPETTGSETITLIAIAVLLGTCLIFLLMKFNLHWFWKLWFFTAITICLTFAFGAFMDQPYPLYLALAITALRVFRPNPILHNISEVFIYGGLAVIFVPLLDVPSAVGLLILFSIYDAYAVWKSKHMIKLAQFQTRSQMFAGMIVPYSLNPKKASKVKGKVKKTKGKAKKVTMIKTAILGGGDMGFPLFFAGAVMVDYGFLATLPVPITATASLYYLLTRGQQNKFYPAMPYLTTGCLIGLAITMLI